MEYKTIKKLWQENKLAIQNNFDKATYECLCLLYKDNYPQGDFQYWSEKKEEYVYITSYQSLRKLKGEIEFFYDDGGIECPEIEVYLEPEEVLKSFKLK